MPGKTAKLSPQTPSWLVEKSAVLSSSFNSSTSKQLLLLLFPSYVPSSNLLATLLLLLRIICSAWWELVTRLARSGVEENWMKKGEEQVQHSKSNGINRRFNGSVTKRQIRRRCRHYPIGTTTSDSDRKSGWIFQAEHFTPCRSREKEKVEIWGLVTKNLRATICHRAIDWSRTLASAFSYTLVSYGQIPKSKQGAIAKP